MLHPKLPEPNLLKAVLQPLLEDFQYWFERSAHLLETEEIPFLSAEEQADFLARIKQAQQEVSAAQSLFQATGCEVGVETGVLMPWHKLLTECWQVTMRYRKEQCAPNGQ